MSRRHIVQIAFAAFCVAGLIAAGWWLLHVGLPPRQTVTLPGGVELTLETITYGKTHRYPGGPLWQRILAPVARWLPRSFGVQAPRNSITTSNDSLCCWLSMRSTNVNAWYSLNLVLSDEAGRSAGGNASETSVALPGGARVRGYCFRNYPRRSSRLLLRNARWSDRTDQHELSDSLIVPNPRPWHFNEWKAAPPPVTGRDGDLEVTLQRLLSGIDRSGSVRGTSDGRSVREYHPAKSLAEVGSMAAFRFRQGGQVVTNWQPVGIDLTDATGNEARSSSWSNFSENDEEGIQWQWAPPADEPAWRMRVEFARNSGFAPEELWTIRGLPATNNLPASGGGSGPWTTNTLLATNLLGSTIELVGLRESRSHGDNDSKARAELVFRIRPEPVGQRFTLVSVTDENGASVNSGGKSWGGGDYRFDLQGVNKVKSLNIVVALHRTRFVDFLVRPQQVK